MDECIHEMPRDQCSYCKPMKVYDGAFWDAKYQQACAFRGCLNPIEVGQRVRWTADGTGVQHGKHR
ncbi:MAG: hypothetical protein ABIQ39_13670 [Ilumatobacteraceae bacterium]